jgi:hypothetical protein
MMSCKNCPDKNIDGTALIVYTGGPPHAPFAAMRLVLRDDGIIRRYQPTVHPDGCIEYKRDAPEPLVPEGYMKDEHNPWILRPVWVSCIYRTYRVQRLDDGQLKINGFCVNPHSGISTREPVTCAKCNLCAVGCAIGSMPVITGHYR